MTSLPNFGVGRPCPSCSPSEGKPQTKHMRLEAPLVHYTAREVELENQLKLAMVFGPVFFPDDRSPNNLTVGCYQMYGMCKGAEFRDTVLTKCMHNADPWPSYPGCKVTSSQTSYSTFWTWAPSKHLCMRIPYSPFSGFIHLFSTQKSTNQEMYMAIANECLWALRIETWCQCQCSSAAPQQLSMHIDIALEVHGHLHPLNLLHMSWRTWEFRALLHAPVTGTIWCEALVAPLPRCPSMIPRRRWAQLSVRSLHYEVRCSGVGEKF
ncbi:hypothetical protein B0H10DRAFT_1969375 [Mycena sp. CBHHK59/15]|nr:hypothetical protein B0H10DRAFT_1969375 [Mycena sp. CBHHK59/15]